MMVKIKIICVIFSILWMCSASLEADSLSRSIERLKKSTSEVEDLSTTSKKRRAYKKVIRSAEMLFRKHKNHPQRFLILKQLFDAQKGLCSVDDDIKNQESLLETAEELLEAPMEYAEARIEADSIFLQFKLNQIKKQGKEKAMPIAEFADRYRDSPAEAKSLVIVSSLAFEIGNKMLLDVFRKRMEDNFKHDAEVSSFLRQRFAASVNAKLPGIYERADGSKLSFPLGQTYLICYWSQDTPLLNKKIEDVKALQARTNLKVYSFNLDELPDSGQKLLKRMKLDWVPIKVPGGINNPLFLSIGGSGHFAAIVIPPHGMANYGSTYNLHGHRHQYSIGHAYNHSRLKSEELELLRSLMIGEFFILNSTGDSEIEYPPELKEFDAKTNLNKKVKLVQGDHAIPNDVLSEIQGCFINHPQRYSKDSKKIMSLYKRAIELSDNALQEYENSEASWFVQNRRMIALLGLWRYTGDPSYVNQAVESAKRVTGKSCPRGAKLISYFAFTIQKLLEQPEKSEEIVRTFIKTYTKSEKQGVVYAMALLLSLESHIKIVYDEAKAQLLDHYAQDESIEMLGSYLLDPGASASLFEKAFPVNKKNDTETKLITKRQLKFKWQEEGGKKISIPSDTNGKVQILLFFNSSEPKKLQKYKTLLDHVQGKVKNENLEVLIFLLGKSSDEFLSDTIKSYSNLKFVQLDDKDQYLLCRKLGLFNRGDKANVFLLDSRGKVGLAISTLNTKFRDNNAYLFPIDTKLIEWNHSLAKKAYIKRDYEEMLKYLQISAPHKSHKREKHQHPFEKPNAHRRKLIWTLMQEKKWEEALDLVNINISEAYGLHNHRYYKGQKLCAICFRPLYGLYVRAVLLERMGKGDAAINEIKKLSYEHCPLTKDRSLFWKEINRYIDVKITRSRSYKDPAVFLREYTKTHRKEKQAHFKGQLENDLLLRSLIYKELKQNNKSDKDLQLAKALAWPYEPSLYHLDDSEFACEVRREQAKEALTKNIWNEVIEFVNKNIEAHQKEALRCNSHCRICDEQAESFLFRAKAFDELENEKGAKESREMAKLLSCPKGKDLEDFDFFPKYYMNLGGPGVSRLNFVEEYMKGNSRSNAKRIQLRYDLAKDLIMRSEAYGNLGETELAEKDMKRAKALTFPLGPMASIKERQVSYVELLGGE